MKTKFLLLLTICCFVLSGHAQTIVTIGTGTNQNSPHSYPCPYGNSWAGARHQMLILASELSAAGAIAGPISALGLSVATPNAVPLSGYTIKLGHTSETSLPAFILTGLTEVYSISSFIPAAGWNMHTFSSDFIWDGISNLLIETCYENAPFSWTNNPVMNQTFTTFLSTCVATSDFGGVCSMNVSYAYSQRPNMQLTMGNAGSVWYIDNDDDGYGTGATVTQVQRPAHGYLEEELTATSGDCDDNNPLINPDLQYLTFSGTPNFINSLCNPLSGTSYTDFTFEVEYFDATNALPPSTFPRVILDYEGNGIFNNANDRVIIMYPYDVSDLNTVDGKRYIGTINSLPLGTDWEARVQIINGTCLTEVGPYDYPDVFSLPDLEIFANDITFSNANPPVSSPQTVTAVVHNVSDFAAQNFYVHLVNQYDNSSPEDILVSNLAPHSSTSVSWTITTPPDPSWCPMQVSIDYTNVINESNELDNIAVRPFINDNYNLPGGIDVLNATASPAVAYSSSGAYTTISGRAVYNGTPVPLPDPGVGGATVTFTIVETNASFTTHTNSEGYFSYSLPSPLGISTYTVTGTATDYTFTGNFSTTFTIIPPPECLPDLRATVSVSSTNIIAGNPISGSITVTNVGCATSGDNTILDISQTGGTPILGSITVPPLDPNQSYTTTFSDLTFNNPGKYSLCCMADATYLVTESNESNNDDCEVIDVIPALPDIYPSSCATPFGTIVFSCSPPGTIAFRLDNSGGVSTGAFDCDIIARLDNVIIETLHYTVTNINAQDFVVFGFPFTFSSAGIYSFEVQCDVPLPYGIVTEADESNNTGIFFITVLDCLPDLEFYSCEFFDVQPADPQFPGTVTYTAVMKNSGNASVPGPIDVRFQLSDGTNYDTQHNGDLGPGQTTVVTVTVPSVAPATQTLTAIADPFDLVTEWTESNNAVENSLCWDFQPVGLCGPNFWDTAYLANQNVYLSVGLNQYNLYKATSVKVRFQVSGPGLPGTVTLGDAVVNNVGQTCLCPLTAACPVSFVFPEAGTYTFTMTADPDGIYAECDETNNVLVVTAEATMLPDMRVLSQFINPSLLNPDPGENITLDITYDNIGISNISDQMELTVLVDNIPLSSVYPVEGLSTNDNATVAIPVPWNSNVPGSHFISAIIDNGNQVTESNETNNGAIRAFIVGDASNLYFELFESSDPSPTLNSLVDINAQIGNNGDLACEADVQFYYISNTLEEQFIGTIHVSVDGNSSTAISLPWTVLDNSTLLIGRIINSSQLEFNYDDNEASTTIGTLAVNLTSVPSCYGGNNGTLTANVSGGDPPYSYLWSNTYNDQVLTAGPGTYSVTITDNTGLAVSATGIISEASGFAVDAGPDEITYFGYPASETVVRTAVVSGGTPPYSYTWTLNRPLICNQINSQGDELFTGGTCTNNICPSSGSPSINPSCSGSETITARLITTATVSVTVTDANGCTATDDFFIDASDIRCFAGNSGEHKVWICHATNSPENPWVEICVDTSAVAAHLAHGDYIGLCMDNKIVIADDQTHVNLNLTLFPNPSMGRVTVVFDSETEHSYTIDLVDIMGRKLATFTGNAVHGENSKELNLEYIEEGMYQLILILNGKREVKKLIIES